MKITSITFNGEMAKAVNYLQKTQTRRIINADIMNHYFQSLVHHATGKFTFVENGKYSPTEADIIEIECPYGRVGDILYVKEPVKVGAWDDEENKVAFDYKASPELLKTPWCQYKHYDEFDELHNQLLAELDRLGIEPEIKEDEERVYYNWLPGQSPFKWMTPEEMPIQAARIFLRIKDIRIERLHDISEEDAIAEGCCLYGPFGEYKGSLHPSGGGMRYRAYQYASRAFRCVWEDIMGSKSWDANPFVWVLEFSKIDRPDNF